MRIFFIGTFLANIIFAFGTLPWMQNTMACHFNAAGQADGFMSPVENAVIMSIIISFVAFMLGCSGLMIKIAFHKPSWVNIPNRDYWLNDENRFQTIRRLRLFMDSMGLWIMAIFLFLQYATFSANQIVPPALNSVQLWIVVGTFLMCMFWDTVRLFSSFRLPK
ncbi:MAG: DUF1648 domain-containing protein [Planctomycetaceae bacterium]|jgi:uncharacterized membrane protein|nr:DUF1648 domain-containing protein [Planctomycetaceae bacterium]